MLSHSFDKGLPCSNQYDALVELQRKRNDLFFSKKTDTPKQNHGCSRNLSGTNIAEFIRVAMPGQRPELPHTKFLPCKQAEVTTKTQIH